MSWYKSLEKAISIANTAIKEDEKKHYKEALSLYDQSKGYFMYSLQELVKVTSDTQVKEAITEKAKLYETRADELRIHLVKQDILKHSPNEFNKESEETGLQK